MGEQRGVADRLSTFASQIKVDPSSAIHMTNLLQEHSIRCARSVALKLSRNSPFCAWNGFSLTSNLSWGRMNRSWMWPVNLQMHWTIMDMQPPSVKLDKVYKFVSTIAQ